jgi:hypothetical protein
MGILQNVLGIAITNHNPIKDSPFYDSFGEGEPNPPPGSERMITESGIFMITEVTLDHMITE